jgi:hypothetical protein
MTVPGTPPAQIAEYVAALEEAVVRLQVEIRDGTVESMRQVAAEVRADLARYDGTGVSGET